MPIIGHVYRIRAQPEFAARHPLARELPRGWQGPQAHPVQSVRLAHGHHRGLTRRAPGRHRHRARARRLHRDPQPAARPRRRRPRHTARRIGLDRLLGPDGHRCRDLALALIVSRILDPTSKLAAARALSPATAASSLGDVLALGGVDEDELYTALDWLLARQPAVEAALAKRHLSNGTLVLYDVSSSYMEGCRCPLAKRGYSRNGRKGTLQIVYGLLCAPDGCPVAI